MDVGDLFNCMPDGRNKPRSKKRQASSSKNQDRFSSKRSRVDSAPPKVQIPEAIREAVRKQKLQKEGSANQSSMVSNNETQLTAAQASLIEEKLEEMEHNHDLQGPLDETRVKKIALNFEKKVLRNQELRIKFPEDPQKFMESEIELNEAIQELHILATDPDLYPTLVELGHIKTLLGLLSHENTDISIAVVDLLQEMTDVESTEESDGPEHLIDEMLEGEILALLVQNLQRLDESNTGDSEGVHNTLAILENMAEMRPETRSEAGPSGLLAWLLKRLKSKGAFDPNKLYASEILAIYIQNNSPNQKFLGTIEGIDILLQQLAQYKRHDPSSSDEEVMLENLFDALCSCLLLESNREPFLLGEGLQLMNLMLREKKLSRNGALRVLANSLSASEGADNCNKFVEILGLRTIFPLFMKTPVKHGKKGLSREQHEELVISILSYLLCNCRSNQRQRLINKFIENDHEKVDRLLELHFKYLEKVLATNTALEEQAQAENLDEDDLYLRRLDGGLFTLQLIDYIMLDICALGPPSIKRRVLKILNVRNASVRTIRNIVREYASNLGDDKGPTKSEEQERILDLIEKFQNT